MRDGNRLTHVVAKMFAGAQPTIFSHRAILNTHQASAYLICSKTATSLSEPSVSPAPSSKPSPPSASPQYQLRATGFLVVRCFSTLLLCTLARPAAGRRSLAGLASLLLSAFSVRRHTKLFSSFSADLVCCSTKHVDGKVNLAGRCVRWQMYIGLMNLIYQSQSIQYKSSFDP